MPASKAAFSSPQNRQRVFKKIIKLKLKKKIPRFDQLQNALIRSVIVDSVLSLSLSSIFGNISFRKRHARVFILKAVVLPRLFICKCHQRKKAGDDRAAAVLITRNEKHRELVRSWEIIQIRRWCLFFFFLHPRGARGSSAQICVWDRGRRQRLPNSSHSILHTWVCQDSVYRFETIKNSTWKNYVSFLALDLTLTQTQTNHVRVCGEQIKPPMIATWIGLKFVSTDTYSTVGFWWRIVLDVL